MEKIRWPKKNDNPFFVKQADPSSPTWACIHWLESLRISDGFLAEAFKEAADKIISELERGEDYRHPDKFFLPIAFLYRHCIELQLKQIIRLGIGMKFIEENKAEDYLREHNLHKLWNCARSIIIGLWPEGPIEELNSAEGILLKFHEIDSSGQNLRYTTDNNGKSTLGRLPGSVDLLQLKDTFQALFNLLDGCEMGLKDAWDMYCEMRRDVGL